MTAIGCGQGKGGFFQIFEGPDLEESARLDGEVFIRTRERGSQKICSPIHSNLLDGLL